MMAEGGSVIGFIVAGFVVGCGSAWIFVSAMDVYRWAYLIGLIAGGLLGFKLGQIGNREHEFIERTSGR